MKFTKFGILRNEFIILKFMLEKKEQCIEHSKNHTLKIEKSRQILQTM